MLKTIQFMAENAGQWYNRLEDKEKAKINNSVARANKAIEYVKLNGLPSQYHGIVKKRFGKSNAAPAGLTDEAVFALDNVISRAVEDQNIFNQIMAPVTTPQTGKKWTTKAYKIDETDVNSSKIWPTPDRTFRNPTQFTIGVEPEGFTGMGFSISYEIPWTEIAENAGSIYSPDYYYALVAAERLGVIADEAGLLGGEGQHMHHDTGLKGIMNQASTQSFTASTITTDGNLRVALWNALSDLKGNFQEGKIVLLMSSGVASQFMYNHHSYTDMTELERVRKELGPYIDEAWVDDRIIGAAAATGNQKMGLFKVGRTTMTNKLVYPLQSIPMNNKVYSGDIKEALIYGNVFGVYGMTPFPVTTALTLTTTDTGFIPNGRLW